MRERRHRRGRFLVQLEQVEARTLLSSATIAAIGRPHHAALVHSLASGSGGPSGSGASSSGVQGEGPQGNATDFLMPTGNPTPHEAARQRFFATYTGNYTVGLGRFDSQSQSFYFRGAGKSTYSLHSDIQLGMVTPKDPTRPLSGAATQFDRNINTNYAYGIDLRADRVTGVDRFGRPTDLTYTTDFNMSAGIAVEAPSQGTIHIRYLSAGAPSRGILTQGRAVMVVKGTIYSLGVSQILRNADINH